MGEFLSEVMTNQDERSHGLRDVDSIFRSEFDRFKCCRLLDK